jgi:Tol biopolymer transport system component
MMKLTSGGRYTDPVWSPDGHYMVFGSSGSLAGLFWIRDDGVGQAQPLLTTGDENFPSSWWNNQLVFSQPSTTAEGLVRILAVTLDSGQLRTAGKPEPIPIGDNMGNIGRNPAAVISPNGQWLAYAAGGSGRPVQVFVQPASGQGKRIQISGDGGQFPVWSRASNELLYRSRDQVMAVSYSVAGDVFTPLGKPRTWCKLEPAVQAVAAPFDLTLDGKRIVVLSLAKTPDSSKADHEVVLVLNFFDYLRQHVPIPK